MMANMSKYIPSMLEEFVKNIFLTWKKYTLGQFFLFMLMFTCSQDNIHGHKILVLQGKGVVVPLQVQTMVCIVTLGPWWFIYAPL